MGKMFFYLLLVLLVITIVSFLIGNHTLGYIAGSVFGSLALGISFIYSSSDDDKYRANNLNTSNIRPKN